MDSVATEQPPHLNGDTKLPDGLFTNPNAKPKIMRIVSTTDDSPSQFDGSGEGSTAFQSPTRARKRGTEKQMNGNSNVAVINGEVGAHGTTATGGKPHREFEKDHKKDIVPHNTRAGQQQQLVSGKHAGTGWQKRTGIHWAPLNVPLRRRLQTLAILIHTLSIPLCVSAFFAMCTVPIFWPLLLPYLVYVLASDAATSGNLKYRSERVRRFPLFSLLASYFPARLHRTHELPATRKYIMGYHPHGIISHGAFTAFATEALGFSQLFPGITNTLLTLDSNFRIPFYRDYILRLGIGSVSRESCENLLSKGGVNGEGMGRAITIVVGGARESLDALPYQMRLVLKRRKGFIKMAIRTGADLVPVLGFGENDIYEQFRPEDHPYIHKFQLLVKKMCGFTIPLFHARGVFNYDVGVLPYRRPLNIVVGKPIVVQQSEKPEAEYVDMIHAQYIDELQRIWDEWKDQFSPEREGELEFVE